MTINLHTEFEALRDTARSLDDLRIWLTQHPDVFTGIRQTMPYSDVDIELEVLFDDLAPSIQKNGTLPIKIRVLSSADWTLHSALASLLPYQPTIGPQLITHAYVVNLPLRDWPLASAFVAGVYFNENWHAITYEPTIAPLRACVGQHIPKHFPGMTLEKIDALYRADLLTTDEKNDSAIANVMTALFNTRHKLPQLSLPGDVTP